MGVTAREAQGGVDARRAARDRASRQLWRLLVAVITGATVVWVVVLLAWRDAPFTLTFDDAYYYLGIARNVVDGHGSTFDQINPTNGYHPLWLGIATIPFLLGLDGLDAARALLVVALLGWAATLLVVARIVVDQVDGWAFGKRGSAADPEAAVKLRRAASIVVAAVVALVAVNPFVAKVVANGLETGLSVPIDALVLLVVLRRGGRALAGSTGARLGLGALLALAFLARTDSLLMIGCLGLWCVAEVVAGRRSAGGNGDGAERPPGVAALVTVFAPPAAVALAYLALNQAAFGSPFQVSGLVKRAELTPATLGMFAVVAAIALLIGRHGFRRLHGAPARRVARFPHTAAVAVRTAWFGAAAVLVVGYYVVLQTQQWLWYYGPVLLLLLVLFVLAVADIVEATVRDRRPGARPFRALAPVAAIFLVPLTLGLVYTGRQVGDPTLRSIQLANMQAGEWIDANLADDAVLSSWDAGAVGYFSRRRVVNLDGVVNSHEFYEALRTRTAPAFLRCRGVAFVTNHGPPGGDPEIVDLIRALYGDEAADRAEAIYAVPFEFSGTTTGSAGTDSSGTRTMGMYVYAVPPELVGTEPDDAC